MADYSIGIDLGTTHCALSYVDLSVGGDGKGTPSVMPVPQLTDPGTIEERSLLPSFLYLPHEEELTPSSRRLPWGDEPHWVVGELARRHGQQVPTRLVASAKSWLCHPGIDRRAAVLPWQAPEEVKKVSPVDASAYYLTYLRAAWHHREAVSRGEDAGSARDRDDEEVILTVPASFDAVARDLTREAAVEAGWTNVRLLEEPQAALYAWLEEVGGDFRSQVSVGDTILVIDIGGGTTDFSLIAVTEEAGELQLARIAVGDHILLGGDNMDLTLAHTLRESLAQEGTKLDTWQFNALTHGCRQAKEALFGDPSLEKAPISIPRRGKALIGGTVKTELTRERLQSVLVDGFFPKASSNEGPTTARRTGLTQMGLPYAQDPAITRHLAALLTRQARSIESADNVPISIRGQSFVHPTAVLFNGGVLKAEILRERMLEVLNGWLEADQGEVVKELHGADLDLSVSRGAAYYGWVRRGNGIRIRGGTARSYYVGVETSMPAVPGFEPPVKALCVAPFGMEEGTEATAASQEFGLVVGEPTRFRLFASSVRREDSVGVMLEEAVENPELEELSPIETTLPSHGADKGEVIPVRLQAAVTEVGVLELHCLERDGERRWKLEFSVRSG